MKCFTIKAIILFTFVILIVSKGCDDETYQKLNLSIKEIKTLNEFKDLYSNYLKCFKTDINAPQGNFSNFEKRIKHFQEFNSKPENADFTLGLSIFTDLSNKERISYFNFNEDKLSTSHNLKNYLPLAHKKKFSYPDLSQEAQR